MSATTGGKEPTTMLQVYWIQMMTRRRRRRRRFGKKGGEDHGPRLRGVCKHHHGRRRKLDTLNRKSLAHLPRRRAARPDHKGVSLAAGGNKRRQRAAASPHTLD